MKKKHENSSYESDGKMGDQKKTKNQKDQKNEEAMFFNTTQNSE